MKRIITGFLTLIIVCSVCGCGTTSLFSNGGKPEFQISVPYMEVYADYDTWCGLKGTFEVTCTDKSKDYLVMLSYALPQTESHALCYVRNGIGRFSYTFYAEDKSGGNVSIEGYAEIKKANPEINVGKFEYHKVNEWMDPYMVFRGEAPIDMPGGDDWCLFFKKTLLSEGQDFMIEFPMDKVSVVVNGKGMISTEYTNDSGIEPTVEIGEIMSAPLDKIDADMVSFGTWETEETSYESLNSTEYNSKIKIDPDFEDTKLVCYQVTLLSGGEYPEGTTFNRLSLFFDGKSSYINFINQGEYQKIDKPEYEITSVGAISFNEADPTSEGMSFSWDSSFYN
jgi:hypothetical protein